MGQEPNGLISDHHANWIERRLIDGRRASMSTVTSLRARLPSDESESLLGQVAGEVARKPAVARFDDLSREVYCILGIPIDAIEMPAVVRSIEVAAANPAPFVISTPNLNFLVNSLEDLEFRESLMLSDLCPTDGMPIVWIARLMGIPIKNRIAGSDIFEALKARPRSEPPLRVFLFGATESVAATAAQMLNAGSPALRCVGWACPGFGTIEEMSSDQFIDQINSSNADFLVAALGAKKGQLWVHRNHHRLQIPIRAHLGATINFQAGTVKRAPSMLQKLGLEWLWRIRQEPHLWGRYWYDGRVLLRLTFTRVLPLAISGRLLGRRCQQNGHNLVIESVQGPDAVTIRLSGFAVVTQVERAIACFREALIAKTNIVIDFSQTHAVDARFLGLLLMLRKQLKAQGRKLEITSPSNSLARMFRLNGVDNLLSPKEGS
jgi:N-acetylglucosaminyldiphosphoundecaprenol N-acetyl-beta-D-mannosaminyltransferase